MARFELFIPESGSLKTKRGVLRSVIDHARNKLNASISEVGYQDLWQRAALGVACTAESATRCRKMLQEVERTISRSAAGAAEITGVTVGVVSLEDIT